MDWLLVATARLDLCLKTLDNAVPIRDDNNRASLTNKEIAEIKNQLVQVRRTVLDQDVNKPVVVYGEEEEGEGEGQGGEDVGDEVRPPPAKKIRVQEPPQLAKDGSTVRELLEVDSLNVHLNGWQ